MEHIVGYCTGRSFANNTTLTNFDKNNGVYFNVDDLLDFSKEKETITDAFVESPTLNSGETSTVAAVYSCNSSYSGSFHGRFIEKVSCRSFNESLEFPENELCEPYDDLVELDWLSNFVEESFSTDDFRLISPSTTAKNSSSHGSSSANSTHSRPIFSSDVAIPAKARSKRSRAVTCGWSARLSHLYLPSDSKSTPLWKRGTAVSKRCFHCASEKTPQWRAGPMGPKTLCNACGVRFRSGRLVPEYRPAGSPTFLPTKHSNSHRKVLELRRQKELHKTK